MHGRLRNGVHTPLTPAAGFLSQELLGPDRFGRSRCSIPLYKVAQVLEHACEPDPNSDDQYG